MVFTENNCGFISRFSFTIMKIPFRLQEQKVFIWHILYSMHSSSYFSAQIQNHAIQLKFSSMKVSHYSSILLLSLPKPCNSRCIILYYRHDNYYRRFHVYLKPHDAKSKLSKMPSYANKVTYYAVIS